MLWLASASPARRRLLEQAAIPHRVRVSGVDERAIHDLDPSRLVQRLAAAKAEAVAEVVATSLGDALNESVASAFVLGCDSLLVFEGEGFGKPRDRTEAVARWRRLAGASGDLLTGHALIPLHGGAVKVETVRTCVWFADLSEAEIQSYVASGEPLACAGGFALEGQGGALVERIEGCFSNVIGLSLPLLRRWLMS
jgi:septum formation protein